MLLFEKDLIDRGLFTSDIKACLTSFPVLSVTDVAAFTGVQTDNNVPAQITIAIEREMILRGKVDFIEHVAFRGLYYNILTADGIKVKSNLRKVHIISQFLRWPMSNYEENPNKSGDEEIVQAIFDEMTDAEEQKLAGLLGQYLVVVIELLGGKAGPAGGDCKTYGTEGLGNF